MKYYNTDFQYDARYTNYPFTQEATKLVDKVFIPNSMFKDIHICVQKAYINLHIDRLSADTDRVVYIHITDKLSKLDLSIQLIGEQETAFVLNLYNTPCGLLQCSSQLYSHLFSILLFCLNKLISVKPSALCFLPECVSVAKTKGLLQINVNGTATNGNSINLKRNLVDIGEGVVAISMYPDDNDSLSDVRLRYINDVSVSGKHIIIKPNTLSDLRVITKDNIQLIGVADVQ